ncbi:MAG: hypothetical protein JWN86_1204 [Planctomycetota bacterium]|nr:hypothetical protein [Planctomycetota bacterium]
MDTTTAATFEVSDVVRAKEPVREVPYKQAIAALLAEGDMERDYGWQNGSVVVDPERPESIESRRIEGCADYHGRLLGGVSFHPVVAAVHCAFMGHRPLSLSPDIIWLMIAQGVANHVNAHSQELRPRLVRHEGRMTIDVRRDDFVKGSPENPWPEVFAAFSAKVREHVGPAIELFVPSFSTTGPVERAASEIVLLDAMKSYFDYVLQTLCGITAITLEGTSEDWETLAVRAEAFAEFGLGTWIELLRPILRQFVRASRGDVDVAFWRSLYRYKNQSGGPVITGWIMGFFPYLKDARTGLASVPLSGLFEPGDEAIHQVLGLENAERSGYAFGAGIGSLPGGLAAAPFRWEYFDKTFPMEFLGGFVGVRQDTETLALRPEIGWAVRDVTETGQAKPPPGRGKRARRGDQ